MKKVYMCSLCHNGILGGGLFLESESVTYKTNKLTVEKKYRNLVLPIKEIKEITWKGIIATFHMIHGEEVRIMIFNKARFIKDLQEYMSNKSQFL